MRIPLSFVVLAPLLLAIGCAKGKPPNLAGVCVNPSNYPVVTENNNTPDKHCVAEWDISKPHVGDDAPGIHHPEVVLNVNQNTQEGADEIVFRHGGKHLFHYDIKPNPPNGVDESMCTESPVALDPKKNDKVDTHKLGRVQGNANGPAECHYKITFYLDDGSNTVIDPHIVIGTGGKSSQ